MNAQGDSDAPNLVSDAPISVGDDDAFGRCRLAERIAFDIARAPSEAGFVVGICGPWGSGKTSIINLIERELDDSIVVVHFNPWLFSGTPALLDRFFVELAASLGKDDRLRRVAAQIAGYAGALSEVISVAPGVGNIASRALRASARAVAAVAERPPLEERRKDLRAALRETGIRVVVFIDDLDRLEDGEIREIVRLVKLAGDMPNLIYVLAFDRDRVEQALGAAEPEEARRRELGRAYLEKIVQSQYDVPPLRTGKLVDYLTRQLNEALAPYEPIVDEHDWSNMVGLAIRDMVRTPRDAKRLANAVPAVIELLGDEVAPVDLLGLQALRTFEPDVHSALPSIADILIGETSVWVDEARRQDENKKRIDEVVSMAKLPDQARQLLGQLFPWAELEIGAGRGHKSEREERLNLRVSSPSILRTYLHQTLEDHAVPVAEIDRFVELLPDQASLRAALDELSGAQLEDVIDRLIDRAASFRPEHAVDAAIPFLAVESRLQDESPFLTQRAPATWQLHWLIGHMLLAEEDESRRGALVETLVDRAPTLSIRLRVINWFGTHTDREKRDPDAEMIDEEATTRLLEDLRRRVAEAPSAELVGEYMFRQLVLGLLDPDEAAGRTIVAGKADDDEFMLALLRSSYGEISSITSGEAAVRRRERLDWPALSHLLGEDALRQRVEQVGATADRSSLDETSAKALDLASRIANGDVDPGQDWP